jgi:hypothetical protein
MRGAAETRGATPPDHGKFPQNLRDLAPWVKESARTIAYAQLIRTWRM